jgi:hypothetical protein
MSKLDSAPAHCAEMARSRIPRVPNAQRRLHRALSAAAVGKGHSTEVEASRIILSYTRHALYTPRMSMLVPAPAIFAARQLSGGKWLLHAPPRNLDLPPWGASQKC